MKLLSTVAALAAVMAVSTSASAFEFVTNGEFESTTYAQSSQFGGQSGASYTQSQGVTGWTGLAGTALQFLYFGGTQTTVSPINRYDDPNAFFYPSLSTLSDTAGGLGGNFVGLDGDQDPNVNVAGSISQVINGLVVGEHYTLSFNWGAAQLFNRTGPTTDSFHVTFGGSTFDTAILPIASGGFSGWQHVQTQFTATQTSQTLSFLAVGTPYGLPPIAVLDSVSLTAVPEPATWAMMLVGFGGIGAMIRRRRQTLATA